MNKLPEAFEHITGLEIFKIRVWLDLVTLDRSEASRTCPFNNFVLTKNNLELSAIKMTHDEFMQLSDCVYVHRNCDYCKYLTKDSEVAKWSCCPCPCAIYDNVEYIANRVSYLLLEYRGLVNKKTQELKQKLVDIRAKEQGD